MFNVCFVVHFFLGVTVCLCTYENIVGLRSCPCRSDEVHSCCSCRTSQFVSRFNFEILDFPIELNGFYSCFLLFCFCCFSHQKLSLVHCGLILSSTMKNFNHLKNPKKISKAQEWSTNYDICFWWFFFFLFFIHYCSRCCKWILLMHTFHSR